MLTQREICEVVSGVAPLYGIEQVYLFGSYARGDATQESDIDFRIVGGEIPSLLELGGLYEDFYSRLGAKIDLVLTGGISKEFYSEIKDHEVLVYDNGKAVSALLQGREKSRKAKGTFNMTLLDKQRRKIERIVRYCDEIDLTTERFGKDYEKFLSDFIYRNSCAMSFVQIGELAARLPDEFRDKYNGVPWGKIKALRNIFAHDYENIDTLSIWNFIEKEIPILREYCRSLLETADKEE